MGLRDGEDMSLLHTHRLQNSTVAPKDLWVTDTVLLHNVHKVTRTFRKSQKEKCVSFIVLSPGHGATLGILLQMSS